MICLEYMESKYLTRAFWALAFLLLLTACVGRPMPAPKPPASFSLVAPTPTARPAGDSLFVIGRFVGDDEVLMRELLKEFTNQSGVEVAYQGDGEVAKLLQQQIKDGRTPDVLLLPKAHWLREMASAEAIPPLSDEVAAAVEAHFSEAWLDLVTYGGYIYGVPFDANAKSLLWYRPDALEKVGRGPPETLEELFELAHELEAQGEVAFVVPGGAGWLLSDWFENVLLASTGTQLYDDLIAHRVAWTNPAVEAAAQEYLSLLRDPWVMGGSQEAATLPLNFESFARAFDPSQAGAAMWLGQGSIANSFAAQKNLLAEETYDLFPFPANGSMIVIGSVAVGTNSRAETMALLNFLAQPEAVEPWVRAGGFISPNHDLPLDTYPTKVARQEAELLASAQRFRTDLSDRLPPNLGFPFFGDQLREMLKRPDDLPSILAEIEKVAIREQGAAPK